MFSLGLCFRDAACQSNGTTVFKNSSFALKLVY
uniref:Uncharacterized protein n=1 Tax=Anguilla anguilla TaxID=7936 RepID=A0A0E9RS28_ANGAN